MIVFFAGGGHLPAPHALYAKFVNEITLGQNACFRCPPSHVPFLILELGRTGDRVLDRFFMFSNRWLRILARQRTFSVLAGSHSSVYFLEETVQLTDISREV